MAHSEIGAHGPSRFRTSKLEHQSMTTLSSPQNRRTADRRPSPEDRIIWTRESPCEYRTAWVHDLAPFGISFITPTLDQPKPGESLELTVGLGDSVPSTQNVRVVHVERFGRYFSVVGCENSD